jgi:hypothetical protein
LTQSGIDAAIAIDQAVNSPRENNHVTFNQAARQNGTLAVFDP